ncbi:MAG TPA: type II secretion system minor pseudopilin GspK [Pseudomonadales bacterium]|nr:type II secretion system minor pseudopilin GspK [Pseudomonadales bacterium]
MRCRLSFQRGIAVITVLLALAIGVLICSEVIMRVYNGVKRSGNHFNTQQGWEYALGGEAWARQQLAADFEKDKSTLKVDHFLEKWAMPLQKMPIEGGSIEVEIYDMQARFNLNNLIDEKGAINTAQVKILRGLFASLGVRPAYADMAARWASYADDNDALYDSEKMPYRAGDTQFGSVSELRMLKDIEMKEYRRVQPFLSALPVPVSININTAPVQVLASMTNNTEQTIERLKSFVEQRKQQLNGYSSPDVFARLANIDEDSLEDQLGVSSEYFEVRTIAEYNGRRVWLISTLFRDAQTGEISLLSRDTSQRFTLGDSGLSSNSNADDVVSGKNSRDSTDDVGEKEDAGNEDEPDQDEPDKEDEQ